MLDKIININQGNRSLCPDRPLLLGKEFSPWKLINIIQLFLVVAVVRQKFLGQAALPRPAIGESTVRKTIAKKWLSLTPWKKPLTAGTKSRCWKSTVFERRLEPFGHTGSFAFMPAAPCSGAIS
jgi:hypothetical protein